MQSKRVKLYLNLLSDEEKIEVREHFLGQMTIYRFREENTITLKLRNVLKIYSKDYSYIDQIRKDALISLPGSSDEKWNELTEILESKYNIKLKTN